MAKKPEPNYEMQSSSAKNLIAEVYANFEETTVFRSPQVPDSYRPPYNSDDLWQKTGSYSIYERMVNDDQVSVCLQLKKDLILGSGWALQVENESDEAMAEELTNLIEDNFESPFEDKLEEILTAYDFGLSITEKLFALKEDNKLYLKDLKTRHPNSFLLHQDDKGNISKIQQYAANGFIDINPKSLIHYINNSRFQNPYGTSDLRAAYNAWFAKNEVIKYLGIFVEGVAKPIPVGKYSQNAPAGTGQNLLNILKNFQAKTALAIPKEVEIDFLQTTNTGEAYHKAINLFNMFIGRSLFIPDLMGMSGSETGGGSFALGDKQINVFFMHINRRRKAIEKLINKHIIWPLVQWNYGNKPDYPKFKFNPIDDNAAVELAKTWLEAVKGKTYKPSEAEINHFRKLVKFPEGPVEFLEQPETNPDGTPKKPNDSLKDKKEGKVEDKKEEKDESKKFAFDYPSGDYHKKCNFAAIKSKLDDYDGSVLAEAKPVIKKIFADLENQLQRKRIVETKNLERIDSLNLKHLAELKQILKKSFQGIYKDGQVQAANEINKSDFRLPTTSDEFLEILENETFTFIGDWKYKVLSKVRTELVAAIKDGKPLSTVLDMMDNEGKKLSEESIERFARTKHTEVMNKGRHEFFQESGVVAGYQYSAILDDRTSAICAGLHGKKFKAGTEPIPPLHFNCRSLLIPITKYEEFEPSESVGKRPIEQFIEEEKGAGFAKYKLEDCSFETEKPSENIEIITYSFNGKPVEKHTVTYSDYTKTKVEGVKKEVIDGTL
jgi:SPP1 gp7 family putative phage head morphogenesis protein